MLSDDMRTKLLKFPSKPVQIVLDTDTKNEIDDQFAVVYALLSSEGIELEAFTAAPFAHNLEIYRRLKVNRAPRDKYPNPAVGMEASYQEILTVLDKMGIKNKIPVYRGSKAAMTSPDEPIQSEAAEKIIELALQERRGMAGWSSYALGTCKRIQFSK
jgi:inosine-uridine nucleoside N-ribohydrolase